MRLVDTPDDLSVLNERDCAAVIWRRRPLPEFQEWIDGLSPDMLPEIRTTLPVDRVFEAMGDVVSGCGMPDCRERDMFVGDVAALAALFADITKSQYLRVRLDPVTTNSCRKFHVDAMIARLICTYRGSGTQYGTAVNGSDPEHIAAVTTGSPMVMRGTLWPELPASDLKHRSPPIEGTGETRLLLVIDPVSDLAEDPGYQMNTRH
ncbi:MAG: DUF1826 domain-containing protein [Pseudomonadota bacterium]